MKDSTKTKPSVGQANATLATGIATSIDIHNPSSGFEELRTEMMSDGDQEGRVATDGDEPEQSASRNNAILSTDELIIAEHIAEAKRRSISDHRRRHSISGSDSEDTPTRGGRAVEFDNDPQYVGITSETRSGEQERPWIPVALRTDKGKGRARSNSVPPVAHAAFRGTGAADETKTPMRGTGAQRLTERMEKITMASTPTFTDLSKVLPTETSSGPSDSSSSDSSSEDSSSGDDWKSNAKQNKSSPNVPSPSYAPFSVIPNTKQGKRGVKSLSKMGDKDLYSGNDKDPEALARWVRKILMNMLTAGVHCDCFAVVSYISQCLSGDADTWFSKHIIDQIQYVYPSDKAWTIASPFPFKRIVKSLKDRFVSTTFNRDAQYKWSRLSQTDNKGKVIMTISALALLIEEVAEQKYLTSEYEMKVRFTEAMIGEIANIVLDKCEIESKRLTWAKIVRVAIKAERSYNQKVATDFARQSGMRISNYEVATNSGAVQRLMNRQLNSGSNGGGNSLGNNGLPRAERNRKKEERSPLNHNAGEAPERSGRTPASGANKTPTGTPSKYSPEQKALYNERRDKGHCYVCGSADHLANHHEDGKMGYMAEIPTMEEFLAMSSQEKRDLIGSNSDSEIEKYEIQSEGTEEDFEYDSDFNGFAPISNNEDDGKHVFEFAAEFSEPRRGKASIRDVSGLTDSEYESDDPDTHGLRTALIASRLEALKIAQNAPCGPLLVDATASTSVTTNEASLAWEEKREAQEAWNIAHTEIKVDEPRHAALNYMQSIAPSYLASNEKTEAFHPETDALPEKRQHVSFSDDSAMESDDDSAVAYVDPELLDAAREVDALCDLPYHPGGTHAGFCLLRHQRDRKDYWGWALSRNSIDDDLPWMVRDHKGLYNVKFNSQGDCSDRDHDKIANHLCSEHCLFNSRWALVAGVPIQGMDVLSPNDAFRHRISLSHTEDTSDFEADADRFAAMGHPIKMGIDDLSDRLPITPDLVFDIKLHGKSGFKAFIDTGSDNSLIAPYLARILKAHIRPYLTPKILKLGTKGSHAMINSYCFLEMELAGIKKLQRFDVANVFTDCVIGRDVLRTHACSIEFGPDRLIARDLAGTTPPKKGKSSRDTAHASFNYMQSTEGHDQKRATKVSDKPHYQRPYDADTPIWDPRHLEKDAERPKFKSRLHRTTASGADVDSDDYKPSEEEISEFHSWCSEEFKEAFIADGDTLPLPPLRPVQHEIPYIDESDPPRPRRNYKIPDKFMDKWNELHEKHIAAGIWIPMQTRNADPIMPVIKKDGKLRPTVDLRARNANTIKMSCPPLETDFLRNTLAAHKMHVELDVKGCFQQLRTRPADVWKTVFSTIRGTYGTLSAQQGDPNSVVTQLAMLSYMFWDQIGKIVVNYADNLFVYANTWRELKARTIEVLVRARLHKFCMNINSFRVCPKWVEVLGMRIKHGEIRMDEGKRDAIAVMNTPHDKKSLQRFIGSVEWLARFIPHLAEVAAPLTELTGNAAWSWTAAQQLAFDEIKRIVEEDRRLTVIVDSDLAPASSSPVHMKEPPKVGQEIENDEAGKYIFLQCDASASGTSATLTVGTNWWSAKTVMTHSRKLTGPQHNYRTHEQELLAVFEGFQKFEGQLLGRKVIVITDNVSLEAFLTGRNFTPRQARVYDYLSQFDFVVKHIAGVNNFVPDMLSRQFEDWPHEPVNQDNSLRDLDTFAALREVRGMPSSYSNQAVNGDSSSEGESLNVTSRPKRQSRPAVRFEIPVAPKAMKKSVVKHPAQNKNEKVEALRAAEAWDFPDNPSVLSLDEHYDFEFRKNIKLGYAHDKFFCKIVDSIADFVHFRLDEQGMLWQDDNVHGMRLCIPNSLIRERSIREVLLEHLHEITGHTSSDKLIAYAQHQFWWPTVAREALLYCKSCPSCQASKKSTTLPSGKLHSLPVPDGPLSDLALDFQGPFPMAKWLGSDVDFVVNFIDLFSGELISIPCNQTITAEGVAELYFAFVFPQWGAPQGLVSDRDVRFNSAFWKALFEGLGTTLFMSSAYHPQTNGKIERMHRDFNQIMRQWVNEDQLNWPQQIPFVQFAINSMQSSSSGFAPFELARTRMPLTIPSWASAPSNLTAGSMIADAKSRLSLARDAIQTARIRQASTANKSRKTEPGAAETMPGQFFYVSTKNWSTVAGRSRKWTPPYVGPFECIWYDKNTSTLRLDLPRRYTSRRISPVFHASQVKMYEESDASLFPHRLANPVPIFPMDSFLPRSAAPVMNVDSQVPLQGGDIHVPAIEFLAGRGLTGADCVKDHYYKNGILWFIIGFPHGHGHWSFDAPQLDTLVRQPHSDLMDRYLTRRHVTEEQFLPAKVPYKPKISKIAQEALDAAELERSLRLSHVRRDIANNDEHAASDRYKSQEFYENTTLSIRRFGHGDPHSKRHRSPSPDYSDSRKQRSSGATPALNDMRI